jgi:hypothetical protein
MPAAQLDPAHGARFFKCDRTCWKSGLRSARFTNAHRRRPSAPPQKIPADPVHCGGQTVPVRMSAFLRHISIMHLLSLGYELYDVRLHRLGSSLVTALTSIDPRREVFPDLLRLLRLGLARRVRFTNRFTELTTNPRFPEPFPPRPGAIRGPGTVCTLIRRLRLTPALSSRTSGAAGRLAVVTANCVCCWLSLLATVRGRCCTSVLYGLPH